MVHYRRCAGAAMAFLLACSPAPAQEEHTRSLIEARDAFEQAIEDGHVERIFSFWTDDVVIYPVDAAPVHGIAAVRAYVRRNREVLRVRPRLTELVVRASASGDLGYTIGTHVWLDAEGRATMPGEYVTLWRRNAAGEWQCFLEIHSPSPTDSAVTAPAT